MRRRPRRRGIPSSAFRPEGGVALPLEGRPAGVDGGRRRAPPRCACSWLYFSTRSPRQGAPVLICPVPMADREVGDEAVDGLAGAVGDHRAASRPLCAISMAATVSVSVPIWLSLISTALAASSRMPRAMRSTLVTKRSSPTSWILLAERLGQELPAVPVVLGQAVLDGRRSGTSSPSRRTGATISRRR